MRQTMRETKELGDFRNLLMYAPNSKLDDIKIVPQSKVTTNDDFFNINNARRENLMSAYRVSPQMVGIIPNNTGDF